MIESFFNWMFAPGTYNDMVVYMAVFVIMLILGMIFAKE
jgi:hypothetical protein